MNASADALVDFARQRIEVGSKSFAGAAKLFDEQHRAHAFMLYAWCRHCDDTVDDQILGHAEPDAGIADPGVARARLGHLRDNTIAALNGRAGEPVYEALARVARDCDIPERYPMDHLAGFAMDVDARHYETLNDTLEYCYHVAGVVGLMMAMIMGVRDRPTLQRACDLGLAFQLTNIARDVADDARLGRVYLPAELLRREGVDPATPMAPAHRTGLVRVVTRLLDEADRYYASAGVGIARLPYRAGMAIASARSVYRAIGERVRARGPNAWDDRTIVPRSSKLAYLAISPVAVAQSRVRSALKTERPRGNLWTPESLRDTI